MPHPLGQPQPHPRLDHNTPQVKRALGAQCFPVGGYAIQAYLPDEEVGISAFLCHGQEKSWFVRVNETLCKVRYMFLLELTAYSTVVL